MHDNHVLCVQLHRNSGDIWHCHELATTTAQPVASVDVRMCPMVVRKNWQLLDAVSSAMSDEQQSCQVASRVNVLVFLETRRNREALTTEHEVKQARRSFNQ